MLWAEHFVGRESFWCLLTSEVGEAYDIKSNSLQVGIFLNQLDHVCPFHH